MSGLYGQLTRLLNSGYLGLGRNFLTVQAYPLRRTIPISQGVDSRVKDVLIIYAELRMF